MQLAEDGGMKVVCAPNEHGTYTWVSTDKVVTEFDPFFICAYGYQDQTDATGPKWLVWMSLAGASQSLTRTFDNGAAAHELLDLIRQAKKVN